MSSILYRRLLAGLLVSASAWATPALAQAGRAATPAPNAQASAERFTELCQTKLKLAPEQSSLLRTYLDQEVNYLNVLAVNGIATETPNLTATEAQQLDQVLGKLLSASQLRDYRKLEQTPQAQAYLGSMALLPTNPDNLAKGKHRQRRNSTMMAQRFDETE
ncbi:hypothetical protein FNT36_12900 [Hymenobacter setariae]|uniref:Uncharacterized protein n=1 Tax=Hymenobacter setariae TaxID=2594794 RepID=A0A558BV81_9BACT|nr:hypothetical protein [Hymenobacter setariae]TVT40373.1 hypothetical protein FNT36_12900 [Hymenobacter setariae]